MKLPASTMVKALGQVFSCAALLCMATTSLADSSAAAGVANSAASSATSNKPAVSRPLRLTGSIKVSNAQPIFVPPSNSVPVTLRNFVPEGSKVKKGDLLLRIESPSGSDIEQMELGLDQTRARMQLDVAKLEVTALEAEKTLASGRAELAKAKVDAALPKSQISALDYDRHQNELQRALRDLEVKQKALQDAQAAVARRVQDGELELKKQQLALGFARAQLAQSEVLADRDGIVVHGFNHWRGERYEEGSSAFPGNLAGQVLSSGAMQVEAFAIEADRPFLQNGQSVSLQFDALPGQQLTGKIDHIASAPESIATWGNGRYFKIAISLPPQHKLTLVSGMSVAVQAQPAKPRKATASTSSADLVIEGDIQSRSNIPVSPPAIRQIWQYTLGQLAQEGSLVKKGDTLAAFQAPELASKIENQRSALNEKTRALEKMKLEQAEANKADDLAVSEAKSNAEKAARKAQVPPELIRRLDYDKFVIEKNVSAELAQLALKLRVVQDKARLAEKRGLESEISQLQATIDLLNKGMAALKIKASRNGMMIYRTNFNGEKFATGSQVWNGLSVAMLADPDHLYVSAKVPEAQAASVFVGQSARINIPGANQVVAAKVSALGTVYHSKSQAQPVIVRDVELEFDKPLKDIKPGATVQATLQMGSQAAQGASK